MRTKNNGEYYNYSVRYKVDVFDKSNPDTRIKILDDVTENNLKEQIERVKKSGVKRVRGKHTKVYKNLFFDNFRQTKNSFLQMIVDDDERFEGFVRADTIKELRKKIESNGYKTYKQPIRCRD